MTRIDLQDEDQIRAILTAQAATAHALKLARARLVVDYCAAGMKATELWAHVDLDTAELAEHSARAEIEAKVLWALHGQAIVGGQREPDGTL
jgi:hypothetical protein